MIFPIRPMCRAWEAFKIEVLKNAYKKIWTKNSNSIVKSKHNFDKKKLNCEFLAARFFFSNLFINYQTIPLVSLLENILYFNFLPNVGWAMTIYNFLLMRPCTLIVLETSQNHFGFFINLVSSFKILGREENLWRPYLI